MSQAFGHNPSIVYLALENIESLVSQVNISNKPVRCCYHIEVVQVFILPLWVLLSPSRGRGCVP